MKICAYGICKNEIKTIARAIDCFKDADYITILDTGSIDGTWEYLCDLAKKDNRINIAQQIFNPFCFDTARNTALAMTPQSCDLTVSFDMDDIFPSNWRQVVEQAFNEGYNGVLGRYQYYINDIQSNGINLDRVAYRNQYHGDGAIHERMVREDGDKLKTVETFVIEHRQIQTVQTEEEKRKLYFAAAKESVHRDPFNPYYGMCYGYECGNMGDKQEACRAFGVLYSLVKDTNSEYLTRKGMRIGANHEGELHGIESYLDIIKKTLKIDNRESPFEDGYNYSGMIEDEAALNSYHCWRMPEALRYGSIAAATNPQDERLQQNLEYYKNGEFWHYYHDDNFVIDFCLKNLKFTDTILDVGPCKGKGATLLSPYFVNIDGVEIFADYVSEYNLKDLYRNIYINDIKDFKFNYYDFILMGDILEHLSVEDAQNTLKYLQERCKYIFIIVPFEYEQNTYDDNIYQIHKQPDLNYRVFLERYPQAEVLFSNEYFGYYIIRGNK